MKIPPLYEDSPMAKKLLTLNWGDKVVTRDGEVAILLDFLCNGQYLIGYGMRSRCSYFAVLPNGKRNPHGEDDWDIIKILEK